MNKTTINLLGISSISYFSNFIKDMDFYNDLSISLDVLFENKDYSLENYVQNGKTKYQEAFWFGKEDYKYGKYKTLKNTNGNMPFYIQELARKIEKELNYTDCYLNSCYINKYNNGGMGKHHDNDSIFKTDKTWNGGKEIKVVTFSLRNSTNVNIYKEYNDLKPIQTLKVEPNSIYVMEENFQNNFYHEISKSKGVRYSITFRHTV